MVKKALIIAAGNGSRLQRKHLDTPKPLRVVAGLPLIKRIILTSKRAGITEFVVVVGYQKEKIIRALTRENLGVKIEFVENPDWQKPNGLSVLAAQKSINENFVLLMSDHIFDVVTLARLREEPLGKNQTLLAVDYKLTRIFDMDDATKVQVSPTGDIQQIGKELPSFNAVDTGMFLCTPELFTALEACAKEGKYSLSNAIQKLSAQNQMGTFDIGAAFWQDVDTKDALQHAEKHLLNACRKPTDGVISRNFNRYVSLFITKYLVKTGISANQATGLISIVGLLSGYFVSFGDYAHVVLGAFLFKMSSILDGCDGEMSKLKLTNSKLGSWLDTASDNLTYLCFMIGLIVGVGRNGNPHIILMGSLTLFGLGMTLFVMFFYLMRNSQSGSLVEVQKDFQGQAGGGWIKKIFSPLVFMVKRDFFALAFFVLALLGQLDLILWGCLIGTNAMWVVLLNTKLGVLKPSPAVAKESPRIP